MFKKIVAVTGLGLLLFTGCSVEPSKVSDSQAKAFAHEITFFKHESGLCFGTIATRKTGNFSQSGIGLATVDCEKVQKYLVN